MGPDDQPLPPAPPTGLPPPGQPSGISGFTGALGAGGPSVPFVPPASIIGAGPQQGAPPLPVGTPTTPLSAAGFAAQQIHTLDAQKGIIGAEAENQAAGQQAAGAINTEAADRYAAQQADQKAAFDKSQAQADARAAALRSDVQAAQAQVVDPNRLWKSKSTGAKVLAGLGVALGAAGASLGHGQNTAMTIFQGAIDSDIAAQKDNIANSWKAVQEKHGLDNDDQTRALHASTWADNYRMAGLENIKLQLASAAAKTSSQTTKNNAIVAGQAVDTQQGALRTQMAQAQAAAYGIASAKAEKLAGEARAMFSKLVEKEGTDPAAAQKVVDSQFPQLQGTAYASAGQKQTAANDLQAQNLARQMVVASNGAVTLDQALKAAKSKVEAASPAYGASAGGPLNVSKETREAAAQHDARIAQLDSFDPKVINPSIVEGLPGHARNKVLEQQESYAKFAREQAIANFRANTGEAIKSPEQIDALVHQYLPAGAYESVERTAMRIAALKHDTEAAARAKGVTTSGRASAPEAAPFIPSGGAPKPGGAADPFVPTGAPIPSASPPPIAPPRERSASFRQ